MTGVMFFSSLFLAHGEEYTPLKELHEAREGGLHVLERCASLNMAKINFANKFKNNSGKKALTGGCLLNPQSRLLPQAKASIVSRGKF